MVTFNFVVNVQVIGGLGTGMFGTTLNIARPTYGTLRILCIVPPVETSSYEFVLYSQNQRAVAGSPGTLTGSMSISENVPLPGGGIITILNAPDGAYTVEFIVDGAGIP